MPGTRKEKLVLEPGRVVRRDRRRIRPTPQKGARTSLREVILLTEEEAGQLRMTAEQLRLEVQTKTKSLKSISGPHIVFQKPDLIEGVVRTTTPLDLSVAFKPNLAPVNMESLAVRARKGIFKKNLTDIVMPYVKPDDDGGFSFAIESAVIPRGNFRIEITIADQNGERTIQGYHFQITRQF